MRRILIASLLASFLLVPTGSFAQTPTTPDPSIILKQIQQLDSFKKLTPDQQNQIEDSVRNTKPETISTLGTLLCPQGIPTGLINPDFKKDPSIVKANLWDTKFSFDKNGKSTLSTCLINSGLMPIKDAQLVLSLLDAKGVLQKIDKS